MNCFVYNNEASYPRRVPFDPEEGYSEYPFTFLSSTGNDYKNNVYSMLREMFHNLGLDADNYGASNWNPLGKWVKPGDTVLLKPNMVVDVNSAENDPIRAMDCTITHPSITRCVFDYVYIALNGRGKIIIADAPIQGCDFEKLKANTGYGGLFDFFHSKATDSLEIITGDLRETIVKFEDGQKIQLNNPNCAFRGKVVNLGEDSYFRDYSHKSKLRVSDYSGLSTVKHHILHRNEYCLSESVIEADVILNLCKPKTHRIAGYTGALKNVIGMNSRKEYLPHHTKGGKGKGGDEYSLSHYVLKLINSNANDIKSWAMSREYRRLYTRMDNLARWMGRKLDKSEGHWDRYGMWHGNDTIWRTILDINRIVLYADKDGMICDDPQRILIHIGDMIVSGEKEGPLRPSYKHIGGILLSENAVEFDYILVKLMGFDFHRLPVLKNALLDNRLYNAEKVSVISNDHRFNHYADDISFSFHYIPTEGWRDAL